MKHLHNNLFRNVNGTNINYIHTHTHTIYYVHSYISIYHAPSLFITNHKIEIINITHTHTQRIHSKFTVYLTTVDTTADQLPVQSHFQFEDYSTSREVEADFAK